jgi:hypothetical protein
MIFRPRSVTAKTNEMYEELKVNGFSWFRGSANGSVDSDADVESQSSESSTAYAVKDGSNEAVRKRNSGILVTNAGISGGASSSSARP